MSRVCRYYEAGVRFTSISLNSVALLSLFIHIVSLAFWLSSSRKQSARYVSAPQQMWIVPVHQTHSGAFLAGWTIVLKTDSKKTNYLKSKFSFVIFFAIYNRNHVLFLTLMRIFQFWHYVVNGIRSTKMMWQVEWCTGLDRNFVCGLCTQQSKNLSK